MINMNKTSQIQKHILAETAILLMKNHTIRILMYLMKF